MDALTLLLERRSHPSLTAPGPEGEALEAILAAGMRVPDFLYLRPYRFFVTTGEGLDRLGALLEQAAIRSGQPPEVVARAPRMPYRAPTVIVVAAIHRPHAIVRQLEQQMTAGCAVMAMQMTALAQGFGGIWRSGWPMFERGLHDALGLGENDQIVGFLYLGTPKAPPPARTIPTESGDHVQWL